MAKRTITVNKGPVAPRGPGFFERLLEPVGRVFSKVENLFAEKSHEDLLRLEGQLDLLETRLREAGYLAQADGLRLGRGQGEHVTEVYGYLWCVLDAMNQELAGKAPPELSAFLVSLRDRVPYRPTKRRKIPSLEQRLYGAFLASLFHLDKPLRDIGAFDASSEVYNFLSKKLPRERCSATDLLPLSVQFSKLRASATLPSTLRGEMERLERWCSKPQEYFL